MKKEAPTDESDEKNKYPNFCEVIKANKNENEENNNEKKKGKTKKKTTNKLGEGSQRELGLEQLVDNITDNIVNYINKLKEIIEERDKKIKENQEESKTLREEALKVGNEFSKLFNEIKKIDSGSDGYEKIEREKSKVKINILRRIIDNLLHDIKEIKEYVTNQQKRVHEVIKLNSYNSENEFYKDKANDLEQEFKEIIEKKREECEQKIKKMIEISREKSKKLKGKFENVSEDLENLFTLEKTNNVLSIKEAMDKKFKTSNYHSLNDNKAMKKGNKDDCYLIDNKYYNKDSSFKYTKEGIEIEVPVKYFSPDSNYCDLFVYCFQQFEKIFSKLVEEITIDTNCKIETVKLEFKKYDERVKKLQTDYNLKLNELKKKEELEEKNKKDKINYLDEEKNKIGAKSGNSLYSQGQSNTCS